MSKKISKMGRPKLAKNKSRGVLVAARFAPPEVKEIDNAVKRSKESKSQWVRNCLLSAARSNNV